MELERTLSENLGGDPALTGISAVEGFRLSVQQRWIWRTQPPEATFRTRGAVELEGLLDERRLRAALEVVVARHEALRTTFRHLPGMALPVQVVDETGGFAWDRTDLTTR